MKLKKRTIADIDVPTVVVEKVLGQGNAAGIHVGNYAKSAGARGILSRDSRAKSVNRVFFNQDWAWTLLAGAFEQGLTVLRTVDDVLGGRGALLWSFIMLLLVILVWRVG